jgi:hypothetical protein
LVLCAAGTLKGAQKQGQQVVSECDQVGLGVVGDRAIGPSLLLIKLVLVHIVDLFQRRKYSRAITPGAGVKGKVLAINISIGLGSAISGHTILNIKS